MTSLRIPSQQHVTLRIVQHATNDDQYRIDMQLVGGTTPSLTVTTVIYFRLSHRVHKDLQWYFEDYLEDQPDTASIIADGIEQKMTDIGTGLFTAIFMADAKTTRLWNTLKPLLQDVSVQIVTPMHQEAAIPWELLRDPGSPIPLALQTRTFVRVINDFRQHTLTSYSTAEIRVLLVICRPLGSEDVPFRSVAERLVDHLSRNAKVLVHVLRPPTFAQLAECLRTAHLHGQPYQIVHFDGHGIFEDLIAKFSGKPSKQKRGYLLFEQSGYAKNNEPIHGAQLGKLLSETGVSILVLNACRSGSVDIDQQTNKQEEFQHQAFGSLAHEVLQAGVPGIVAMRYNVYVATAAQFVGDLYIGLTEGSSLGESASQARKHLAEQPLREFISVPRTLQDWYVPVIYETQPIALFDLSDTQKPVLSEPTRNAVEAYLNSKVIQPINQHFCGQDEILLALDRAFDQHHVVWMWGCVGSGKTAIATEFAKWYLLTGGLRGRILFSTLKKHSSLFTLLDEIGEVFSDILVLVGVDWATSDIQARTHISLQLIKTIPILWIWDDIESLVSISRTAATGWEPETQLQLGTFVQALQLTQAKLLLISRESTCRWLDTPFLRIAVPPMRMHERIQLLRAVGQHHGYQFDDVSAWIPLLQYSGGNALSLIHLTTEALLSGSLNQVQLQAFVNAAQAGEIAFSNITSLGYTRELDIPSKYHFADAFDVEERKVLALLYLFRRYVDLQVLQKLVGYMTMEGIAALLLRVVEVGLLTPLSAGKYRLHPMLPWILREWYLEYYPDEIRESSSTIITIKPESQNHVVPCTTQAAVYAFVHIIGTLAEYYGHTYNDGDYDVLPLLACEENNLLFSWEIAWAHKWWPALRSLMKGLHRLYVSDGRRAAWATLVDQVMLEVLDPTTATARPGHEAEWSDIVGYRASILQQERRWSEAAQLYQLQINVLMQDTAPLLTLPIDMLNATERECIHTLAITVNNLALALMRQNKVESLQCYQEAVQLFALSGDRKAESTCASHLGNLYYLIPAIRNLDLAEYWQNRSLELCDKQDFIQQASCKISLGTIRALRVVPEHGSRLGQAKTLLMHFNGDIISEAVVASSLYSKEGLTFANNLSAQSSKISRLVTKVARSQIFKRWRGGQAFEETQQELTQAAELCEQAISMLPKYEDHLLAVAHQNLAYIYRNLGNSDAAIMHYKESISHREDNGTMYEAAQVRLNLVHTLLLTGRITDSIVHAQTTLKILRTFDKPVKRDIRIAQTFLVCGHLLQIMSRPLQWIQQNLLDH